MTLASAEFHTLVSVAQDAQRVSSCAQYLVALSRRPLSFKLARCRIERCANELDIWDVSRLRCCCAEFEQVGHACAHAVNGNCAPM